MRAVKRIVREIRREYVLPADAHETDVTKAIARAHEDQNNEGIVTDIRVLGTSNELIVYWKEETT
jgi:hypothetical protein